MSLDTYRTPVAMSALGRHQRLFANLPHDVGALADIVQGVLLHEHIAPAYGVELTPDQHGEAHIRILERRAKALGAGRPADRRPPA